MKAITLRYRGGAKAIAAAAFKKLAGRGNASGNQCVPDTAEQSNWRVEFQQAGECEVRQNLLNAAIYNNAAKRGFARQWLREQERARQLREQQIHSYTQYTFWAAVAAVIVGVTAVVVTCLH
jgi:hypothetical protein